MAKISIIRGDDHTFTMTFTDDAGDPIDLTDVQVDFTVKRQSEINAPTDADVILKKTVTNAGDPTFGAGASRSYRVVPVITGRYYRVSTNHNANATSGTSKVTLEMIRPL